MDIKGLSNKYISREYAVLAFMVLATFVANISNYGFNIIAARWLGKDDYGALAALLSIFLIFSVPTTALQAVMAKYVAIFKVEGEEARISSLLKGLVRILALIGVGLFVVFAALSGVISGFLKIDSSLPIVVLGSAIAVAGLYPIFLGSLQGYQYFGHMGTNMMFQAFARVLVGIFLIQIGWGVSGAMGASTLALAAAIVLAYFQGRSIFDIRRPPQEVNLKEIFAEFIPAMIMFAIFWSYTGVDVVIAKRVLSSGLAGDYACAVFMGKIILFLPTAVSMVMFPKTAELWALRRRTVGVFARYFIIGVALSGFVGVLYIIVPRFLISLLYGSEYLNAAQVMGIFGVAMTFYTAVNILIMYFVSVKTTRLPNVIMAGALIVEVLAMSAFARSLKQFAYIHLGLAVLLVLALFLVVFRIGVLERSLPENAARESTDAEAVNQPQG
jgi:O-antigen/teichoic acid export membrane protein